MTPVLRSAVASGGAVAHQRPSCYMCWITDRSLMHHSRITHASLTDHLRITHGHSWITHGSLTGAEHEDEDEGLHQGVHH